MRRFGPLCIRLLIIGAGLLVSSVALSQPNSALLHTPGAGTGRIPIAVLPFAGENQLPARLTGIVEDDLQRSGRFRLLSSVVVDPVPTEPSEVRFSEGRSRRSHAMVIGSVEPLADGRHEVRVRLLDVPKQEQLIGLRYIMAPGELRLTAHRIADAIYERLTGERGLFSTRIAYVAQHYEGYELQIADADGQNAQTVLASSEPIISPAWSPDGTRLAYVSFENSKPVVYVHSLTSGERKTIANFSGSNSAPSWSPDGRQLALVLSRDGGSQLYLMSEDGSGLRRLTQTSAIDTEPFFSPDGRFIYFTSNRAGSPQIYRMPAGGGRAQRLTAGGTYSFSPRISADGRLLAFISRKAGRFRLTVMDLSSRRTWVVTDSQRDESPTFSPDGRLLLYATKAGGRGVLRAVSIDGRLRQKFGIQANEAREPAWGPYTRGAH